MYNNNIEKTSYIKKNGTKNRIRESNSVSFVGHVPRLLAREIALNVLIFTSDDSNLQ